MKKYAVISSAILNITPFTTKLTFAIVTIGQNIKIHN